MGAEGEAVAPNGSLSPALGNDAIDISDAVAQDLANTLSVDAGAGPVASGVESSVIEIAGLVAVPAVEVEAAEDVGNLLLDVAALEAFGARADHQPLPPGLHRTHRGIERAGLLRAGPILHLRRRALRRGPFPVNRVPGLIRSTLALAVQARVGPLATTAGRLCPGASIIVIAPVLRGSRPHDVLLTVAGPGYTAARLLRVVNATAGATIRLPRHLHHGTWTITVQDLSEITSTPDHSLHGAALVRIAVFRV
jgi:hypothetical protein